MMMKYSKYIHWMSSHKTFPFTTLSIFLLLISSSNGRPQGNDTEPIVTTTTYVSTVSPNGSATTVPSPTTTTENTPFPSTIDASSITTTAPESNASSLETTFPSTLPPSSVSNGTTATEEEESNSSQTSTVTSTAPPIQQNLTSSSTIDTTTAKKGESDPTTTTAPVVTTTNIDNNDSTLDPMTTILDGNYTLSSHEVGSEELSTTPSIFTTSTKHELVSTSLESSSPSSPPSISTPVEDTTITTTTRAVETSTLSPSPDTTTTSTSNNIYAPTDESLITTSPEDTVKLLDTTITIIPLHSTSQSPNSNITVTTIIPMDTTASPSSETDSSPSSSVVTTTITLTDEPSTSIVVQGSSKGDDVEMLETTTLPPHFNEESIKTSKSPILTQHEKGDGKVKNGMNSNHSKVMVKMEEKLDDLQYQIYALCGSFGVISLLIVVLLVALAYSMSKLKDQVSSTRHVPYIPDNRTDIYSGDQIHAYDNSAFSTGHEMQERRRSNLDKEVPKPGYGIHNGNNPYEKYDTKSKDDRRKMENIPLDTLRENEAESSQNKKPNTTDRDSKSTLMRYEDGVIPCNNDSTTPNGSMGRRPS